MKKIMLFFENIVASFKLLGCTQVYGLILKLLTTVAEIVLPLLLAIYQRSLIEAAVSSATTVQKIFMIAVAIMILLLFQNIMSKGYDLINSIIMSRLDMKLKKQILRKCSRIKLYVYDTPQFYEKIAVAERMSSGSLNEIISSVFSFVMFFAQMISYSIILCTFSWLFLCMVVLAAATALVSGKFRLSYEDFDKKRTYLVRKMRYFQDMVIQGQYTKEIKSFRFVPYISNLYRKYHIDWNKSEMEYSKRDRKAYFIFFAVRQFLLFALPSVYIVYSIGYKKIGIADFTYYTSIIMLCYSAVSGVIDLLLGDAIVSGRIRDYFDFIKLPCEVRNGRTMLLSKGAPAPCIRFENVSFRYEGTEDYALKDINLTIQSGEKIALIGENGSGKTTLIKLLCGLYEPTQGNIFINGENYKEFSQESLYALFSVVFQDFVNYEMSLASSVMLGSRRDRKDEEIWMALEKVGAGNLRYKKFNNNVDTPIGAQIFSDGTVLSGGENQKVALARVISQDRSVVILDEPTANLDADTEVAILTQMTKKVTGKTTVLISHRLNAAMLCDRIILLSNGIVLESGSHTALMQLRGKYYNMFMAQAENYRDSE